MTLELPLRISSTLNLRELDDDNLAGAFKAIRDEVAKQLGVDDGDRARIRFVYSQERGEFAVRVSVRELEA